MDAVANPNGDGLKHSRNFDYWQTAACLLKQMKEVSDNLLPSPDMQWFLTLTIFLV